MDISVINKSFHGDIAIFFFKNFLLRAVFQFFVQISLKSHHILNFPGSQFQPVWLPLYFVFCEFQQLPSLTLFGWKEN